MQHIYERSAHQMNALLSEIKLFLVRAACELKSARYGSKHVLQSLPYAVLCVLTRTSRKLKIVRAVSEIWTESYGSKHASLPLSDLSVLTLITRKLQVVHRRSTYQKIALLSAMFNFCVRAGFDVRLASYGSKHASQSLSDKPFVSHA